MTREDSTYMVMWCVSGRWVPPLSEGGTQTNHNVYLQVTASKVDGGARSHTRQPERGPVGRGTDCGAESLSSLIKLGMLLFVQVKMWGCIS